MTNKKIVALYIYGACTVAALLILIVKGGKPVNSFLVYEAMGFGLSMSIIPIGFIYAKSPRAGYIAAAIISSIFLAQAISPKLAGALTVISIAAGIVYFILLQIRSYQAKRKLQSQAVADKKC